MSCLLMLIKQSPMTILLILFILSTSLHRLFSVPSVPPWFNSRRPHPKLSYLLVHEHEFVAVKNQAAGVGQAVLLDVRSDVLLLLFGWWAAVGKFKQVIYLGGRLRMALLDSPGKVF